MSRRTSHPVYNRPKDAMPRRPGQTDGLPKKKSKGRS